MIPDAAIRFLGADPAVYRPIARAQSLILARRALPRGGPKIRLLGGLTPFQIECIAVAFISLYLMSWLIRTPSPLVGVAFTLVAGGALLLFDLVSDRFDVLADPDEYQVIAAHPHDAWSVVLAKVMAIGRSTAILAACAFTAPAIAAGFAFHSVGAAFAYALAAAALTVAVSTGGMFAAAAVVALGGRRALQRAVPVVHMVTLALYLGIMGGRGLITRIAPSSIEALGWIQWVLPPIWFAAPVEVVVGRAAPTSVTRGALALGSFLVLVPLFARWIRNRFDERILEPTVRRARPAVARGAVRTRRTLAAWQLGPRVFLSLLREHLRSDVYLRGGLMSALFVMAIMIVGTYTAGEEARAHSEYVVGMLAFGAATALSVLNRVFQMSSRPQALWFVLIAPEIRLTYSQAAVWLIRVAVLLPVMLAAAVYAAVAGSGPLLTRMLFVLLAAILCDTMLVASRGTFSALPFSKPVMIKERIRWGPLLGSVYLTAVAGAFLFGFVLLARINPLVGLIPILGAIPVRMGLGWWAGRRVRRSAWAAEGV